MESLTRHWGTEGFTFTVSSSWSRKERESSGRASAHSTCTSHLHPLLVTMVTAKASHLPFAIRPPLWLKSRRHHHHHHHHHDWLQKYVIVEAESFPWNLNTTASLGFLNKWTKSTVFIWGNYFCARIETKLLQESLHLKVQLILWGRSRFLSVAEASGTFSSRFSAA